MPGIKDGNWHGLCVTWQKEDGFFKVYYDGRSLLTGTDFKTGKLISSKGIFTLGIGAHDGLLYSGRLGHVNAWPSILDNPHLAVLSSKCGVERGELVSWPDFGQGNHGIYAIEGATCPFTGKIELTLNKLFFHVNSQSGFILAHDVSWRVFLCVPPRHRPPYAEEI